VLAVAVAVAGLAMHLELVELVVVEMELATLDLPRLEMEQPILVVEEVVVVVLHQRVAMEVLVLLS
jgi:hypothetical protein